MLEIVAASTENNDSELVIRIQMGDVQAFDILYWKYHQAVYANINKLIKDGEAAKDILQDVFITLWEKCHTIDPNQSVANWLFVVSYNKSISYLKKVLKESVYNIELQNQMQVVEEADFNVKEEQLQLLEEALQHLSTQRKKVFELCKLQGKTYEEAAKELNISKHTVKEYLSEAIAKIKDFIKNNPGHIACFVCPVLLFQFLS